MKRTIARHFRSNAYGLVAIFIAMLARAPQALVVVVLLTSMVQPAAHGNDVSRRASEEVHALPVGSGERPVTIRFSSRVHVYVERQESEPSCSLRLRRGSDGVEVLRAAVDQDCIRSFRTVRRAGRVWLHCINDVCAHVTNRQGRVPDTRWGADWTGDGGEHGQSDYQRFGLQGFSASDGDLFTASLYLLIIR